jgi:hypothetical protein
MIIDYNNTWIFEVAVCAQKGFRFLQKPGTQKMMAKIRGQIEQVCPTGENG